MKETEKAFFWIIDILEKRQIPYKITGGFAARVYGVKRELADIDIEVADTDVEKISNDVKDFITYGPALYCDDNWELKVMTLEYQGQEIDITSSEGVLFNQITKNWEPYLGSLTEVVFHNVFGKKVPLETKDALIAYKLKLGRAVDRQDVQQLKGMV